MKKFLIVAAVLSLLVCVGQAQSLTTTPVVTDGGRVIQPLPAQNFDQSRGSLTTHYNGGNGFAGNTFDLTPAADLTLTDMDIHWSLASEILVVDIYYKLGTAYGFELNPGAWTHMYTATGVVSAGAGLPTNLGGITGAPTMLAGQTYGVAFSVTNYATTGGSLTYTNGQNTYSNSEVTLLTQHGLADPIFVGGAFFPREFNGTIYYDAGPVPASVDITVNGDDAGVIVNDGENVKIDIMVNAGVDQGLNTDIFVIVRNDAQKKWCFNLAQDRWFKGWCYEYVTGPLDDYIDTVLDMPLPIGGYDAWLAIDTVPNGNLDRGSLLVYDTVDFEVVAYTPPLYDNGDTDGTNGYSHGVAYFGTSHRRILDDFIVPGGENWSIDTFSNFSLPDLGTPVGYDMQLAFQADNGGTPGAVVATATTVSFTEVATGRVWFGRPEFDQVHVINPVALGAGTYWINFGVDATDNYFAMIKATITGSELWIDYTDLGYYGTGSGYFGAPADVAFMLWGTK